MNDFNDLCVFRAVFFEHFPAVASARCRLSISVDSWVVDCCMVRSSVRPLRLSVDLIFSQLLPSRVRSGRTWSVWSGVVSDQIPSARIKERVLNKSQNS